MSMITKMLVMRNGGNGNDGGQMRGGNYGGYNRDRSGYNEYNVDTINYGGGMSYDSYRGGEIENRRRRDSRGRFMESDDDRRMEMRGGDMRMPPRYPRYERGTGGIENRIGYDMRGDDEEPEMYWPPYWRGGDMHHGGERERGEMERGHGKGKMSFMPMDERTAKRWVNHMQNADGSEGEKWSMEQAEQIMRQAGIDCEPAEFYAVLNAIYSDYAEVAKKHHMDTVEYYVDMARAWLEDEDAVKHKAMAYYECVVKHDK